MKWRVVVPRETSSNLNQMQEIFRRAAEEAGHTQCLSFVDTEFLIEEDL
jgi:hypothetical protein